MLPGAHRCVVVRVVGVDQRIEALRRGERQLAAHGHRIGFVVIRPDPVFGVAVVLVAGHGQAPGGAIAEAAA